LGISYAAIQVGLTREAGNRSINENRAIFVVYPRGEQSDQEATWGWGGGVGFGCPAGKRGTYSPRPRGGTGHSPYGAPNGLGQLGIPPPPWRGPQNGSGDYPTTRPGGGGGYRTNPRKIGPSLVKWFFAHLLCLPLYDISLVFSFFLFIRYHTTV